MVGLVYSRRLVWSNYGRLVALSLFGTIVMKVLVTTPLYPPPPSGYSRRTGPLEVPRISGNPIPNHPSLNKQRTIQYKH